MVTKGKVAKWPNMGSLHTCPVRENNFHDGKIIGWRWILLRAHTTDLKSEIFPARSFAEGAAEALYEIEEWAPIPFAKDGRTCAVPPEK